MLISLFCKTLLLCNPDFTKTRKCILCGAPMSLYFEHTVYLCCHLLADILAKNIFPYMLFPEMPIEE